MRIGSEKWAHQRRYTPRRMLIGPRARLLKLEDLSDWASAQTPAAVRG
jgi:hypothetical protein